MKNNRSREWFQAPDYYGFGRRAWLRSEGFPPDVFDGKPVIGICNSWSELNNCNAHLRDVAAAVKRGVWAAGGVPLEFPTISLGEMFMRPTTMMYRNLMAMDVEESIRANPLDAVVLLCGCDKTTPAQLMGAASADIPAIVVPGGPMLAGEWRGQRLGSGTDGKKLFDQFRTGRITEEEWCEIEGSIARTAGHCTVMGTASTMTSLAEALGMTLPGSANIPAPDSRRMAMAELSGRAVVEMIEPGLKPSRILTRIGRWDVGAARQRHAQRFGQAGHRGRRAHHRAVPGRACDRAFDLAPFIFGNATGSELIEQLLAVEYRSRAVARATRPPASGRRARRSREYRHWPRPSVARAWSCRSRITAPRHPADWRGWILPRPSP